MHLQRGGHAHSKVDRGGVGGVGCDAVCVRFLTEGVDNGRTGWVKDEKVFTPANVGSIEAALEAEARKHAARDAQPLPAAHRGEGDRRRRASREIGIVAGVSDDLFGIDVATGQQIWHDALRRRTESAAASRTTRSAPADRPRCRRWRRSSPGKYTVYAVSWDGRLRQINAADGEDAAPPEKFMPRRRQAVRAQPAQRRHLHRDRAGLRRPDQRVLLVRPRATRATARSFRRAAACGAAAARRSSPDGTRLSRHRRRPVRSRQPRASATRIVGVKLDANKQLQLADYFGAPNANWLWRRDLDVNTTPVAVRLSRPQVPRRHEQGMPAVAARSRRARRRGSSHHAAHDAAHLQRRAGVRRTRRLGRAERVAGRRAARSGCSCRSGAR